MSVYQFRCFTGLDPTAGLLSDSQSFTDIYLHRRHCTLVGIKFRDPKRKHYGWKLSHFQCKVAQLEHHQGVLMEKWAKYKFMLPDTFKLVTSLGHDSKKLSSPDSEKEEPNAATEDTELSKLGAKLHKRVSKVLLKSELGNNKVVMEWCARYPQEQKAEFPVQVQIFIIEKTKSKGSGKEKGWMKIQRAIHEPQILYFWTESVESKSYEELINKCKQGGNTSYPALLERLLLGQVQNKKEKQATEWDEA